MDIATYEIIRSSFYAIAREMKIAMMRTAGSPLIYASGDSSAAIFDADMQLVAQGNDIPTMLGSAVISTKVSVEAIGKENLSPGDVIVSNDVYLGGGNHQPDIQFTRPVFRDGKIVAFAMTRAHWGDIGGQAPGSYTVSTWDVFAEGVRIPPALLYRDDRPVRDVLNLLIANTRIPSELSLDIQAQYAGVFVGDRRLAELFDKYGADSCRASMSRTLDHSEKLVRELIRGMPDGTYQAEEQLDPIQAPGWPLERPVIKVQVTIAGDHITFDFSGTGPQVRGGLNCPLPVTCNSAWFVVKALTDVTTPINQGCYRPVTIIAPEGSVLNCCYPASVVSGNTETSPRVIDLILKALAPALPQRVLGQSNCTASPGIFSGRETNNGRLRRTGLEFVTMHDVHAGGMGARADKDGVSGVRVYVGNTGSQPVEMIERDHPLLVEEWCLVADSGGAGEFRGGLAARRTYRVEYDEATFTVCGERGMSLPEGVFGGRPGAPFTCTIKRASGETTAVPSKGAMSVVRHGDRVSIQPSGSGGYGDPKKRKRASVLADLTDGYVTQAAARSDYAWVADATNSSPREKILAVARPLAGICVVEIGHSLAAPYAGMILGALGAEIIKVEDSGHGDYARDWGPPFIDGASALFHAVNHDKKSISINLATSDDVQRLRQLIFARADVVLQNLKAGSTEKYGIGAKELIDAKPSLVYCNVGAFGEVGPLRHKPGYDPLMQALSGQMSLTGSPGEEFTRIPISLNDMGTGLWASVGVLAALHRRQATGRGEIVSVSLFETALSWAGIQIADYLASGILPGRWGSGTAAIVPYQAFECADGPIMVAAGNDHLFQRLCHVLDLPELIEDVRFRTNGMRVSNRETLIQRLAAVFRTRPADQCLQVLDEAGIPSGAIQRLDQAIEHSQTKALDIIDRSSNGAVPFVGLPITFGGHRPRSNGRTPKLGEHNDILDRRKRGER